MELWRSIAVADVTNDGAAGHNPNSRSSYSRSCENLRYHATVTARNQENNR
jgi:hypothetical protein